MVSELERQMANNPKGMSLSQRMIPIFHGSNCEVWSIKMKSLFILQDLWDLVERGYPIDGVTTDTLKDARKRDVKVFAVFYID